jgi:hypothetical protein
VVDCVDLVSDFEVVLVVDAFFELEALTTSRVLVKLGGAILSCFHVTISRYALQFAIRQAQLGCGLSSRQALARLENHQTLTG